MHKGIDRPDDTTHDSPDVLHRAEGLRIGVRRRRDQTQGIGEQIDRPFPDPGRFLSGDGMRAHEMHAGRNQ